MAKMTLLSMVQNILSAMDSDEVNSIFDTVEAEQVAEIIKETYYDLFSDMYVPEHKSIIHLEGLADTSRPNYLRIPDGVTSIDWVKYKDEETDKWTTLSFMEQECFVDLLLRNEATLDNVTLVDHDGLGFEYYIKNNTAPRYYTIFDDEYLVCDAFKADYESTLHASNTLAWGIVEPEWSVEDDFIPDLDTECFPLLLSEAKSVSFINLKQTASQKEEQRSRRHRVHLQYRKWRSRTEQDSKFSSGVNYARNK